MQQGPRERIEYPKNYKGFVLLRAWGRFYGFPPFLEPNETYHEAKLLSHPSTLRAATLEELQTLIDQFDLQPYETKQIEQRDGFELIQLGGSYYAVPQEAGRVNLHLEADRRRACVIQSDNLQELRERVHKARLARPVEFAGWLPIYEVFGNCGAHPQFTHTGNPPAAPQRKGQAMSQHHTDEPFGGPKPIRNPQPVDASPAQPLPLVKLILHKNPAHDMMAVVRTIMELTRFCVAEAMHKMWEAHHSGRSQLLVTYRERAELFVELFADRGVTVTIEPN